MFNKDFSDSQKEFIKKAIKDNLNEFFYEAGITTQSISKNVSEISKNASESILRLRDIQRTQEALLQLLTVLNHDRQVEADKTLFKATAKYSDDARQKLMDQVKSNGKTLEKPEAKKQRKPIVKIKSAYDNPDYIPRYSVREAAKRLNTTPYSLSRRASKLRLKPSNHFETSKGGVWRKAPYVYKRGKKTIKAEREQFFYSDYALREISASMRGE
ncbi:hypothetical protein [uncultured Lactobacillus sp.]|uniref:hypothetical protein n=1 Tax=uncultured Lactobacillus sp. TaxID=153152 RepID=UPI002613F56B|nr:hypothetical protein [uncultured Lactobacillus sp.]